MTTTDRPDLTKWLARIAGLIAKAESTEFPDEAKALYAKAEQLKKQFQIEEEELLALDPTSIKPIHEMWTLCTAWSRHRASYTSLMQAVARHCEIMIKFVRAGDNLAVRAVGYEVDVRFAMLLWNAVAVAFQTRIDVQYDETVPEREMIYRLRSSGIERQKVARMIWGEEVGSKSSAHAKVGKTYKEECAARGEEAVLNGKGIDLATYRRAYSEAFDRRFRVRLRDARDGAGEAGGVVFAGRKERVQEAFWDIFPEDRPSQDLDVREGRPIPNAEVEVQEEECQRCKRSKSASGKCPDHKPWTPTLAQERAWNRQINSAAASAGRVAGRQAADSVELQGVKRANRIGA